MQVDPRPPGQQPPVKIYNAVYSSVQVYECMVRGIAVMRRRADSYVNATQILKVAGVDKGRRTKILEKEILPGKHEIVQGGYGKYQGTWIPLERGRDIAQQYGVAPLLAPLFDFIPSTNAIGALPAGMPTLAHAAGRSLSASSSFGSLGTPSAFAPGGLAPPPIMPGSALRLLNQGRAQGLFTPSTATLEVPGYVPPGPYYPGHYPSAPYNPLSAVSPTPPPMPPPGQPLLKRARSDTDGDAMMYNNYHSPIPPSASALVVPPDIQPGGSRPPSVSSSLHEPDGPSPNKRARIEPSPSPISMPAPLSPPRPTPSRPPSTGINGIIGSSVSAQQLQQQQEPTQRRQQLRQVTNGKVQIDRETEEGVPPPTFATKPNIPRTMDLAAPLRDQRRAAIISAICIHDDPAPVLDGLRDIPPDEYGLSFDIDLVLDDQGHTALHLAASMARHQLVQALLAAGADANRGNHNGETPLMRATLDTSNFDTQTFHILVSALHVSLRVVDTSKKSVLHHIVASAGVKGRAVAARYYLEQVLYYIAQKQRGSFRSIVDFQDEHGDTALNIAARVGNRSLVRTLLDVGADRLLPNKLGLRPGDFGVETEELGGGPRAEDILSSLRSRPSVPAQKSEDILSDIKAMIQGLSTDFSAELKPKQDLLDVTQAQLRAATRELSEQRKQIQTWQARCTELDLVTQRTRNLERALEDDNSFDWTGRSCLDGSDARTVAGSAFARRGQPGVAATVDLSFNLDPEPPVSTMDSVANLIKLRRQKMWHARMDVLMREKLQHLQGASAEKEFQCKKIVSLCTGVPVDKVEDLLENLVIAVESESQVIDIGRVSGFMQKVRNGVI